MSIAGMPAGVEERTRTSWDWKKRLKAGCVIPAHPLALTAARKLDERHQRALTRYYLDSGAGGVAVGVHTTQFQIRDKKIGLYEPVLALAAEECAGHDVVRVAGICGDTAQAASEAALAKQLGYHAGLVSLSALPHATVPELVDHLRAVGEIIPVFGFYLQPAVGGRLLSYEFWRECAALECVVGIKIAPFSRYETQEVMRGVADSGRASEVALYTGNDDHIILDLMQTFRFGGQKLQFVGGLLGHWAYGTRQAVSQLEGLRKELREKQTLSAEWLSLAGEVTDMNQAVFDVAHAYHGCLAGINEVLRRQGLLAGRECLDPHEDLSEGQASEMDRVMRAYPHLTDDVFVAENRDRWLK